MTVKQALDSLVPSVYVRLIIRRDSPVNGSDTLMDQMNMAECFKDPLYHQFHSLVLKPIYLGIYREYQCVVLEVNLPANSDMAPNT